ARARERPPLVVGVAGVDAGPAENDLHVNVRLAKSVAQPRSADSRSRSRYASRSQTSRCGCSRSSISRYLAKPGFVIGVSLKAAFMSPELLIRRRAIAIGTFSLPWKSLLATSESIFICT